MSTKPADLRLKKRMLQMGKDWKGGELNIPGKRQIMNKKEYAFWKRKVKLLSPKKGDILIVPAEANFDFWTLSEMLKHTPIKFALIVPQGKASLKDKKEAIRFVEKILSRIKASKSK